MNRKTTSKNDTATRLRMLRAEYKLTQAEVANKLGITQQTYSKYENQSINLDSEAIIKICSLYGVSSDYLLGIESSKKIRSTNGRASKESLNTETLAYETTEEDIEKIVKKVLAEMNDK